MLSLLLLLFSQVSVSATGINITDADVSKVLSPLTSWTGSFFDVIVAFAGVIIVIWFVKLVVRFITKKD